jgi:hypothetical protein
MGTVPSDISGLASLLYDGPITDMVHVLLPSCYLRRVLCELRGGVTVTPHHQLVRLTAFCA